MLKNDIHHCKTSGIFLRLGAGGLIADNNIHSNCEAGVDIRKGANPLILVLMGFFSFDWALDIYREEEAGKSPAIDPLL